jgi:hypothetical protein
MTGKVYKIICGDLCYYGSTIQSLAQRFTDHKRSYNKWCKGMGYEYNACFPLFDLGDPQIVLVEEHIDITKSKLRDIEYSYITTTQNNVNIHGKKSKDIHEIHNIFKKKYPDRRPSPYITWAFESPPNLKQSP